ncbi:MAG: hypothetical protein ABI556_17210 [Gemmatimonadales bacterium]
MLPEITLVFALFASSAQNGAPCNLMDRATVIALLGPASTAGTPTGPEPDDETSGTLRYCTFRAGAAAVLISQVNFSSAAEARKATTRELVISRMDGDDAKLVDEPGLGDKAWWAYTSEGAQFVVLKGSVVIGVALGGELAKKPVSYRNVLRAATVAALLKM